MTPPAHRMLLLVTLVSAAAFAADVTPPAPSVTAAPNPQSAGKPTENSPDPATAWQRPRVFLGALVEDGGSFDGKPMPRVTRLIAGSIFDKMGIKEGDHLATINGTAITSSEVFRTFNATLKPSDALQLTVVREGVSRELTGVAEAAPRPREILAATAALKDQVTQLTDEVDRVKVRTNLEETLRLLREFEAGLPAAAAEFKRVYPGGTFHIQLHVDIRSEASDANAKPLLPTAVNDFTSSATPTPATSPATLTGLLSGDKKTADSAPPIAAPIPPNATAPDRAAASSAP